MGDERPPLWTCPRCQRQFANRNQSHACASYTIAEHLADKSPEAIVIYRRLEVMVQTLGPVTILPEGTRIAFQVRMSFAAAMLRRHWVDAHVVLARRLEAPRFRSIQTISPRNHVHAFRLASPGEVDDEVYRWLAEAYQVGEQRHLARER
jgi:hypothetical protein